MVRRSAPASRRWEAQLCLRLWGERGFVIPALWAACRQADQTTLGVMGTSAQSKTAAGLRVIPMTARVKSELQKWHITTTQISDYVFFNPQRPSTHIRSVKNSLA